VTPADTTGQRLTAAVAVLALALAGCSGPHTIGYSLDPLEGPPVKFSTPVLVRTFADRRPVDERYEPDDAVDFRFYSSDWSFKEPVDKAVTRALQLELANSGIEVADAGNFLLGRKPHIRVSGDILHFHVSRREMPVDTLQHNVKTLWRRERYSVRVSLRIKVIDAKLRKLVMKRVYTSGDSFPLRSEMIDVKAYASGKPIEDARWQGAGDDYCVQLLNDHLKRILVQVRQDIIRLLTPEGSHTSSSPDEL